MVRKRKITKWSSSLALSISTYDIRDLDLGHKDIVNLSSLKVLEKHDGSKPFNIQDPAKRLRSLSKWSTALVLIIPYYDARDLGFEVGDIIDLDSLEIVERIHNKEGEKENGK